MTTKRGYGSASGRHKAGESGDWERSYFATFRSFWRTKWRSRPRPFPFPFCGGGGWGEEPQKIRKGTWVRGVATKVSEGVSSERRSEPRAHRSEIPLDRSVRFNPKPPRAPRVRSGFAQRSVFRHSHKSCKTTICYNITMLENVDLISGMGSISTFLAFGFVFGMLIFWTGVFFILYHLIRFGVGVQPKKISLIFISGSVLLSLVTTLFFIQVFISLR
jgi:hypothetical protein